MSTISAGLVNATNITVTGSQSGAVTTSVLNASNLTAQVINAQTLNVPSTNSQFVVQNRSSVVMAGKDYENTNYQSATDGCGNILPFFNTAALGQGPNNMNQLNLPQFGAFSVTNPLNSKAMQQTFQGVCDADFVYFVWEIGQYNPDYWTGTFLAAWLTLLGNAGDWPITTALIVKLNRLNGQVVSAVPIGLMMDNAYLAAGSTKEAQELALGPCPYDSSGAYGIKDASGFFITTAVTGNNKYAPGYVGFQTVVDSSNIASWVGCGDDNCRGPIHLYYDTVLQQNVMYITSMSQKYASVYKVRCSDLTLVWRRTVDSLYDVYTANPAATQANRCMRQVMVIPPRTGRSYPVVVTATTDNWAYSTIDFTDTIKLFNYFKSGGTLQAWADYGFTAGTDVDENTNAPLWQTLMGPTPLNPGDALPYTVFRQAPPGTTSFLTVNGVTEQADSSGFILDEEDNVSLNLYTPLQAGYLFTDGSANSTLASGCKTTGVFNLLTGKTWPSLTSSLLPVSSVLNTSIPSAPYEYEFAKFDFTTSNENPFIPNPLYPIFGPEYVTPGFYNVYIAPAAAGGTPGYFDPSAYYIAVPQNGPWCNGNVPGLIYSPGVGQIANPFVNIDAVPVQGLDILKGVPDANGLYFTQQTPVQYQPVTKKIYKAQVGRAIVNDYEASELNTYAGGIYLNLAYDVDTDVIIAPTGQFVHTGTDTDRIASKQILADVSANGVFYPGVNTSYEVRDDSDNLIYNSYQRYYIDTSAGYPLLPNKIYDPTPEQIAGLCYDPYYFPIRSEPVVTSTFNGVGNGYFKGISYDSSGFPIFVANHSYSKDFYQQNFSTDYNKGALQSYYFNPWVDLRCQADSSGLPLTSYSLSPQLWIPGADSSGNVSDYRQSVFINSRQRAYWNKVIALRDNQHFGARYNRQGACGVTGVKVSTGELMFSVNFHGYDIADHSYSEFDVAGGHAPIGIFKTGGYNADGCSATIVKMTDLSGQVPSYLPTTFNRKILACTTKARFIMLDYDRLVDTSGNSLTLTHVPGDTSLDYRQGCETNTWTDSLIYEDRFGMASLICAFNGYGTDGTNFLMNVVGQTASINGNANPVNCNVPGKEVHGLDMDPMCNFPSMNGLPGYWMPPLGLFEPLLGPFSLPPGVPNGGATDAQLYAFMVNARSTYNNNLSPVDPVNLVAVSSFLRFGLIQYYGNFDYSNRVTINGSYNAQASYKTNCYDLQTILNNNWRGQDYLNIPETVLKYQFMSSDGYSSRTNNQGTQIYGNLVFSGNSNGLIEVYDINTGYPVNQENPQQPGQFVTNSRTSTVGIYNPEGQRIIPLIVDGVMYGYGGNNKWNNAPPGSVQNCYATKIFMWTPFGK